MSKRAFYCVLLGAVLLVVLLAQPVAADHGCWWEGPVKHCHFDGTTPVPGQPGGPGNGTDPPGERPPIRYLILDTDFTGTDCYWWSRAAVPGAIDTWDPANDPTTIVTLLNYPACASPPPVPAVNPADRAWEVYRSWTLARPAPSLSPPDGGITGLPTYVGTTASALSHRETLPSGIDLVVAADVSSVTIDWGDGWVQHYSLTETAPYPTGVASHIYALKSCSADYRETDPNGHLCHPTLEAYPVTVTFTWTAGYEYDGGWTELESVDLSTTIPYDVDEVVGIPSG